MSGVVVDLIYRVRRVPLAGEEADVTGFDMAAGGGYNAMIAAKRAGMDVSYGGTLGQGVFADTVVLAMQAEEIAILQPPSETIDQGCCVVLIDDDGERTFIAKDGAEGIMRPAHPAGIDPTAFDWILLSGYTLAYENSQNALKAWLSALPDGAKLIFDPSPIVDQIPEDIREAAMAAATWISANASEARVLCGLSDPKESSAVLAIKARPDGGAVVRMGAEGCIIAEKDRLSCPVAGFSVDTIDTNGAGDTHLGAFAAALSRGEAPIDAAKIANATAAMSTTREGPATAPGLNEVKAFLASQHCT